MGGGGVVVLGEGETGDHRCPKMRLSYRSNPLFQCPLINSLVRGQMG